MIALNFIIKAVIGKSMLWKIKFIGRLKLEKFL